MVQVVSKKIIIKSDSGLDVETDIFRIIFLEFLICISNKHVVNSYFWILCVMFSKCMRFLQKVSGNMGKGSWSVKMPTSYVLLV